MLKFHTQLNSYTERLHVSFGLHKQAYAYCYTNLLVFFKEFNSRITSVLAGHDVPEQGRLTLIHTTDVQTIAHPLWRTQEATPSDLANHIYISDAPCADREAKD